MTEEDCATPACPNPLTQRLACPKCQQLGIPVAYFCGQSCFAANYNQHKQVHTLYQQLVKQQQQQQQQQSSFDPTTTCPDDATMEQKLHMPAWAREYRFTGTLRPTLLSPRRSIPSRIKQPDYASHAAGVCTTEQNERNQPPHIRCYTDAEINDEAGLRHACHMGRQVLDIAGKAARVGVTTDELDRIVHEATLERDCYPSPLNYYQFPKSVCTSVNEVICHGIPDHGELCDGDIVNIDISTYNQAGYHGDLNETFMVGNVDADGQKLVKTAFDCLAAALELVRPGTLYRDLGAVIERKAKESQCSVVRTYCGHGIGHELFHTIPNVPHYAKNKAKGVMKVGHVFTIEPMINLGTAGDKTWGDDWTAVTMDGKRSAQFEHTLVVTETGYDLLTKRENEPVMTWKPELLQRY